MTDDSTGPKVVWASRGCGSSWPGSVESLESEAKAMTAKQELLKFIAGATTTRAQEGRMAALLDQAINDERAQMRADYAGLVRLVEVYLDAVQRELRYKYDNLRTKMAIAVEAYRENE